MIDLVNHLTSVKKSYEFPTINLRFYNSIWWHDTVILLSFFIFFIYYFKKIKVFGFQQIVFLWWFDDPESISTIKNLFKLPFSKWPPCTKIFQSVKISTNFGFWGQLKVQSSFLAAVLLFIQFSKWLPKIAFFKFRSNQILFLWWIEDPESICGIDLSFCHHFRLGEEFGDICVGIPTQL